MEPIDISLITVADIDDLIPIEKASFPSPWTEAFFKDELNVPVSISYRARLGGPEGPLVGYIMCHLILDELHILNIAVHQQYRRIGIAGALFNHSLENNPRAKIVYLEVREPNKPARAFYRKMGFVEVGKRRKYYSDTGDDAVLMAWNIE